MKVGHVYQAVPRLTPVTAVSSSYQTSAAKNSGTKTAFLRAVDAQEEENSIFDRRSVRFFCKQFMEASAFQSGGGKKKKPDGKRVDWIPAHSRAVIPSKPA